jgi:hypothetical protein
MKTAVAAVPAAKICTSSDVVAKPSFTDNCSELAQSKHSPVCVQPGQIT